MLKPKMVQIEVDMIPMIDIISLLLMFLIVVGDLKTSAENIDMRLPRADQGITDAENNIIRGRVVIQLLKREKDYCAVIGNHQFELLDHARNKTLNEHLTRHIESEIEHREAHRDPKGIVDIPVKLRIPEGAPMHEVEKVIFICAHLGLVNIQYAAQPNHN